MPYRHVQQDAVTLLCFPPYDEVFAHIAARHLDALPAPDVDALQAALRDAYPQAVVRPREAFAALGDGRAWYVYRDGRYSPFDDAPPWWDEPDAAWVAIDTEGRYVDANESALRIFDMDLDTLRTMHSGDLTDAATRPTVPWVWELLDAAGELHSTSRLRTPSGRLVPVEYRLVRRAEGAISYLREVPAEAVAATVDAESGGDERPAPT